MKIVGSWAVLRQGQPLVCFTARDEAARHAAALSLALDGEELFIAWIAGAIAMSREAPALLAARKWRGPTPTFLNAKGSPR